MHQDQQTGRWTDELTDLGSRVRRLPQDTVERSQAHTDTAGGGCPAGRSGVPGRYVRRGRLSSARRQVGGAVVDVPDHAVRHQAGQPAVDRRR